MRSLKKIDRDRRTARRQSIELPDVSSPPAGVVKNSFVTTIRYKQTARAIRAYREAIEEAGRAKIALANLEEAKLEHERTMRLLENAETVHEADAAEREVATRISANGTASRSQCRFIIKSTHKSRNRTQSN